MEGSGGSWTHLEPGEFMGNYLMWAEPTINPLRAREVDDPRDTGIRGERDDLPHGLLERGEVDAINAGKGGSVSGLPTYPFTTSTSDGSAALAGSSVNALMSVAPARSRRPTTIILPMLPGAPATNIVTGIPFTPFEQRVSGTARGDPEVGPAMPSAAPAAARQK